MERPGRFAYAFLMMMYSAFVRTAVRRIATTGVCAAVFALPACTTTSPVEPATETGQAPDTPVIQAKEYQDYQDYDALVARARQEIKRAADLGFLWINTESYLAEADEAHEAGDMDRALKLGQKALEEALLAQRQAADSARTKADYTYRR